MDTNRIKKTVKEAYGKIAGQQEGCGCGCGQGTSAPGELAAAVGYSPEELATIPASANLGLSCGNPTAQTGLREGEVVLDLGSGAGFDSFLAAAKVGATGKVIGVDMTPEMIDKARNNALKSQIKNVEFRLGDIEHLPLPDNAVDVVISNCVINLVPDKAKALAEIHRVLKPGGRVSISDIALRKELPKAIRESIEGYVGCVSGALLIDDYQGIINESKLQNGRITVQATSGCCSMDSNDPIAQALGEAFGENALALVGSVVSVLVEAQKGD